MTRGRKGVLTRLAGAAVALAVVVTGLAAVELDGRSSSAKAATALLGAFDPADIISDAVMWRSSAMSASAIQNFLDAQQPSCISGATCLRTQKIDIPALQANPMCKAVSPARSQTVAAVLAKVGVACGVNPQVLLVMLQKEQTLVTGRRPYRGETVDLIYRKATGLGCPDTAACDPAKYGLFNQLYGAAYWLVRYTTPPGTTGPGWTAFNWFPIGRPATVAYNPSAACGGRTITIRNKATAALYYYTPYQPNAAALSAGWGLGDPCSAYGNRNFFLYFTTWFGSTHAAKPPVTVSGVIATAWKAAGGAKGALGAPKANALPSAVAGGGTTQEFAHGTVYSSKSGTIALTGRILARYTAVGGPGGVLGWPRTAVATRKANGGGRVAAFQGGSVYDSSRGTGAVSGAILTRYLAAKAEAGVLGWPTGDAVRSTVHGGGTVQRFAGGRIAGAGRSAYLVTGQVLERWQLRGLESGTLGWPTGEEKKLSAHGSTGTVQPFQGGTAYIRKGRLITVNGPTMADYAHHDGPAGRLGWPEASVGVSTANGGGSVQRFTGGKIYWSKKLGAHPLVGQELALYNARGGTKGSLGWPGVRTADPHGIGGHVTPFTSGRIYSSKAGTVAVRSTLLKMYLAEKGTAGRLGWPTQGARRSGTKVTQRFEHGVLPRR